MAEYVRVPNEHVLPIGDAVSFEAAAVAMDSVLTPWFALHRARERGDLRLVPAREQLTYYLNCFGAIVLTSCDDANKVHSGPGAVLVAEPNKVGGLHGITIGIASRVRHLTTVWK